MSDTGVAVSSNTANGRPRGTGRVRRSVYGLVLAALTCGAWTVAVCSARADATTLFGIEGFRVEVIALSPAARGLGFSEIGLRAMVHEHLRRNGLNAGDFPNRLSITLRVVEHPAAVLAYSLELQVRQVVHLKRTEQMHLLAPTWTEGRLTMVPRTGLRRSVEGALFELCDALSRDYRRVNA